MKAGNVHQYLGLARKANKCAFGALVKDSIIKKRAYVVLIDEGASANTKKKYYDSCRFYNIRIFEVEKGLISGATGKETAMVTSVCDVSFADKIIDQIKN